MKTFLILIVIERYLKSSDSLPRSSAVTHTANTENTVRNIMTALNMDKLCEERKREEAHRLCSCGGGVRTLVTWLSQGWCWLVEVCETDRCAAHGPVRRFRLRVTEHTRVAFPPEWNSLWKWTSVLKHNTVVKSKRFSLKLKEQNRHQKISASHLSC